MSDEPLWDTAHAHRTAWGELLAPDAIGQESGIGVALDRMGQASPKQQDIGVHEDRASAPHTTRMTPQTPGSASAISKVAAWSRRFMVRL